MSYTLTVKRANKPDIVRTGLDQLNAVVIAAELKMAYPGAVESGYMSIDIKEE